jgi:hypothetical protein
MMHRYHRHERFPKAVRSDPAGQILLEIARQQQRDFILDCFDLVEGRPTAGAKRAEAERTRLLKLAREAKRRALCGADPLNITNHTGGKKAKQILGADPIEYVGPLARVRPAMSRLTGKNKLDQQQVLAADTYRSAFETLHSSLGGSMDFNRVRGSGRGGGHSEAAADASLTMQAARNRVGVRAIVIIEQVVCHGRTAEECAKLIYSYTDGETVAARDINFVGRSLREALSELGELWYPTSSRSQRSRTFRPAESRPGAGQAGTVPLKGGAYVSR